MAVLFVVIEMILLNFCVVRFRGLFYFVTFVQLPCFEKYGAGKVRGEALKGLAGFKTRTRLFAGLGKKRKKLFLGGNEKNRPGLDVKLHPGALLWHSS